VSRITTGRLALRREAVPLADVIRSAIDTAKPLIDARGHTLGITLPVERVDVDADATRLAQVFSNLLNNAANYTQPGGRIDVAAATDAWQVTVTIRDNGIGIAPEMIATVFRMFAQADASLERVQGGLGVGLTLARHLVELHGGSIEAKSEGSGRGSEFIVRLPRAKSAAASSPEPIGAVAKRASDRHFATAAKVGSDSTFRTHPCNARRACGKVESDPTFGPCFCCYFCRSSRWHSVCGEWRIVNASPHAHP
jgi:two-component sensor histidine kinase